MGNQVYTFKTKKEFKELISKEKKVALQMYKNTGKDVYKSYYKWLKLGLDRILSSPIEVLKELKINSLKEFAIESDADLQVRLSRLGEVFHEGYNEEKADKEAEERRQVVIGVNRKILSWIFSEGQTQLQK